jgi:hypothetical protein
MMTASGKRASRRSTSRRWTRILRTTGARRRRSEKETNARPNSRTLVNSTPERLSACMGTALAISSLTTAISRATSRPRGSRSRAAAGAGPGAGPGVGPVPAARRGAACASARASRHGTGTDSALTLQLPSFTGRFRRRGRSKKYPGKISRVHADGTFDVSCNDAVSFEAPSIRRLLPASRGRAPLWFYDGLTTQTTTARARLGSRRALSRRLTRAAIPTAEVIGSARATRSKPIIGAAANSTRARFRGTAATIRTILPTMTASAKRASRSA